MEESHRHLFVKVLTDSSTSRLPTLFITSFFFIFNVLSRFNEPLLMPILLLRFSLSPSISSDDNSTKNLLHHNQQSNVRTMSSSCIYTHHRRLVFFFFFFFLMPCQPSIALFCWNIIKRKKKKKI